MPARRGGGAALRDFLNHRNSCIPYTNVVKHSSSLEVL